MTNDLALKGSYAVFESIKEANEQKSEYWSARKLAKTLGYSEYRHFLPVIEKAKEACVNSGQDIKNHFEDVLDMIELGKTATRQVQNILLSRYACYLIMQNADPSKEIVALGQTYFAIQTRRQELFDQLADNEKRLYIRGEVSKENKKLFGTAKRAGVSRFGLFNDAGYRGLYGKSLAEIEEKKGIKKGELLDRAGSTELAANLFRITQTDEKLRKDNILGEREATNTHNMVGGKVRQTIKEIGGVLPEDLPVERHIRELERELKQIGATEHKRITSADEQSLPAENLTIRIPKKSTTGLLIKLNKLLRNNLGSIPVIIEIAHQDGSIKGLVLPFTVKVTDKLKLEVDFLLSNLQ